VVSRPNLGCYTPLCGFLHISGIVFAGVTK
jgi:hypothetical protein